MAGLSGALHMSWTLKKTERKPARANHDRNREYRRRGRGRWRSRRASAATPRFQPDHILWLKARGNLGPNRGLQQGFPHSASTQTFGE
jgi:HSP20 family protein